MSLGRDSEPSAFNAVSPKARKTKKPKMKYFIARIENRGISYCEGERYVNAEFFLMVL